LTPSSWCWLVCLSQSRSGHRRQKICFHVMSCLLLCSSAFWPHHSWSQMLTHAQTTLLQLDCAKESQSKFTTKLNHYPKNVALLLPKSTFHSKHGCRHFIAKQTSVPLPGRPN
jgi:hypothetical protein